MKRDTPTPATASPLNEPASEFALSSQMLPGVIRVIDMITILLIGVATFYITAPTGVLMSTPHFAMPFFISILYFFISDKADLFSINAIMQPLRRADDIIIAFSTAFCFFLSALFALNTEEEFSRRWLLLFPIATSLTLVIFRLGVWQVLRFLARRHVIGRTMVVLGDGEQSQRFLRRLKETQPFLISVLGVFSATPNSDEVEIEQFPVLGDIDDLFEAARQRTVDDVVVALAWSADQKVINTIERLKELPVNVYLSTDLVGYELAFRPAVGSFREFPMFEVTQRPISGWNGALKQCEDYLLGGMLLVLLSPLMLVIAIAIKLDSKGPIFFMQKRLGFNNKEFLIYKFRSMFHDRPPETAVIQATRDDPRVTRVGRFLRTTSLDELPQILNVLNGSMSLVGPRPHAVSHNVEYGKHIRGYFARHRVKPGITGWAQVNGLRGETQLLEKMEARIRHDIYYTENWSIAFDLRILFVTAFVAFTQKTAY